MSEEAARRSEPGPPSGPLLLAIDNGSQSTKVSIVDANGTVFATGRCPLRPAVHPEPGHVVHPDDDLWHSVTVACRDAMSRFDGDPARIVGVGLCTIRFCRALLDSTGRLAAPVLSWMDERVSRAYVADDPAVAFVSTSSGYLTRRLTGELVDFAGNTQGRWPIDHGTWQWSGDDALIEREGIPRDKLLPLAMPGESVGRITAEAADATGLPEGVPVFATSNDKAVEALGSGLVDEDEVLLSLGTYVSSMTIGEAGFAPPQTPGVWRNFGAMPGATLYESEGVRRGMWTVSWYRDLVFRGGAGDDGEHEAALERLAECVEPGCGGLLTMLDWLAPADQPHRRGAFIGFDGSQGAGHMYRSIIEALAFTMADHSRSMMSSLDRTPQRLIVSGGGARSPLMLRILAAVYGVPVRRAVVPDAAGLGAAITAAVGTGVHASWERAIRAMVRTDAVIDVDPDLAAAYEPAADRHRRLRRLLPELLERLR